MMAPVGRAVCKALHSRPVVFHRAGGSGSPPASCSARKASAPQPALRASTANRSRALREVARPSARSTASAPRRASSVAIRWPARAATARSSASVPRARSNRPKATIELRRDQPPEVTQPGGGVSLRRPQSLGDQLRRGRGLAALRQQAARRFEVGLDLLVGFAAGAEFLRQDDEFRERARRLATVALDPRLNEANRRRFGLLAARVEQCQRRRQVALRRDDIAPHRPVLAETE